MIVRLFLASLFVFATLPFTASAQDSAGVSINPATIEDSADPGQFIETSIDITNLSGTAQEYYVFARDIIGVRDGNAPEFAEEGREQTGFELSTWVTLPEEPYTLEPGGRVTVPVTIQVPDNASPGSHFGGVFVSIEPPRLRTVGASVGYEVASIISLKISGDAITNAQIREFSTDKIIHGLTDVNFNVRLQNTGNVLVRPHGPLEVYNMFGSRVYEASFNDSLGGVFPGTIRDFKIAWRDENPGFGRYQAVLALVYEDDNGNRTIDATVSFWILPLNIIFPAAIVLAVLLVVSYIGVRIYVRRAVQSASGGRRQLARTRRKSKQVSVLMLVSVVLLTVTALFLILLLLMFA